MPVVERVRADGSKAYLAQIDIVRKGERYRENRTFDKKRHAEQGNRRKIKTLAVCAVVGGAYDGLDHARVPVFAPFAVKRDVALH